MSPGSGPTQQTPPLRGMFHTQGCEGLDTGVTRLSTLLGLWPWGEEQAHRIRPLSRPPNYIVSPRPGNKGFTRPSARAQPVWSRSKPKCLFDPYNTVWGQSLNSSPRGLGQKTQHRGRGSACVGVRGAQGPQFWPVSGLALAGCVPREVA